MVSFIIGLILWIAILSAIFVFLAIVVMAIQWAFVTVLQTIDKTRHFFTKKRL